MRLDGLTSNERLLVGVTDGQLFGGMVSVIALNDAAAQVLGGDLSILFSAPGLLRRRRTICDRTLKGTLDAWFHTPLERGSSRRQAANSVDNRVSALFPAETSWDANSLARVLPLIVTSFVERLDDDHLTLAHADQVAEDAALMRGLLVRIRTLLDTFREEGTVFALCPRCGLWEAEVGINAYALAIAAPLPVQLLPGPPSRIRHWQWSWFRGRGGPCPVRPEFALSCRVLAWGSLAPFARVC